MGMFNTLDTSASALTAQSFRMDVIAQNVANATTTRTENGEPYRRRTVVLAQQQASFADTLASARSDLESGRGVMVAKTAEDMTPFELVYDPASEDADENGYVRMPNVDVTREYVDMISATRSYEANITVMNATKRMAVKALEIGK